MNRFTRMLAAGLALALLAPMPASSAEQVEPEAFYNVVAFGDFQQNLQEALDKGKKGMLVYFYQDACPFCKKMEKEVFTRPIVHDFMHKYFDVYKVNIKGNKQFVDVDGDQLPQTDFAVQYRARATPTLIIFGPEGEEAVRFVTNPTAEEMLALGKFVVDGAHKEDMDFFEYKSANTDGIRAEIREDYL